MSKIICDICGTTYQDTADCCPICGCTRDAAAALLGDDLLEEETVEEPKAKGGRFSSKKKEIFNYDEVNSELDENDEEEEEEDETSYDDEEEDEYEEGPRHNTFAVILLTVLIVALLAAAGFLFVRYFLPNMGGDEEPVPTTVPQFMETTADTTVPGIPCQTMSLTSGTAELNQEGQYFLIHVKTVPEDTTDPILYASADESIATVSEDGRITAVSEGETEIYITCGNVQLSCKVVCHFVEETEPPTEETAAETEAAVEGDEEQTSEDTVVETTAETAAAAKSDVVLKLKKTDIRLGVYYEYQLMLDCDLEQNEVEWSSEHPHIATVDENGVVKAIKSGTTSIIAKYGDQEVSCIVRCSY